MSTRPMSQRAKLIGLLRCYPDAPLRELLDRMWSDHGIAMDPIYANRIVGAVRAPRRLKRGPLTGNLITWTPDMLATLARGAREGETVGRIAHRVGVSDTALARGCLILVQRLLLAQKRREAQKRQEARQWRVAAE